MPDFTSELRILPIARHHIDFGFDCGEPTINEFLALSANMDNSFRVYTGVDAREHVLGFYAITAINIEFEKMPSTLPDPIQDYPIQAARISHLAVDKSFQRKGIGISLLIDALQRIQRAEAETGLKIVMVEAQNDRLRSFYLHFGFIPVAGENSRLFLPMQRVTQLFREDVH